MVSIVVLPLTCVRNFSSQHLGWTLAGWVFPKESTAPVRFIQTGAILIHVIRDCADALIITCS